MMIHNVNSFNNIRFKYTSSSYSLSRISRQMSSSDEDLGMISKVYHYYQYYQYYSFFKYYDYDYYIL